jgi:hypothetical protein
MAERPKWRLLMGFLLTITGSALIGVLFWWGYARDPLIGMDAALITFGSVFSIAVVLFVCRLIARAFDAAARFIGRLKVGNKFQRFGAWLLTPWPFGVISFIVISRVFTHVLPPVTCRDGWPSPSIGHRGACSWHGGVDGGWQSLGLIAAAVAAVILGLWRSHRIEQAEAERRRLREVAKPPITYPPMPPMCPKCGKIMRNRLAQRGKHAGERFWGCSRYPSCKGTRPMAADDSIKL